MVFVIPLVIDSQGSFYHDDFTGRIRLVQKVAKGMSCRRAAAHFEVSPSSAMRFTYQYETEGSVAPKVRKPYKRRLDPYSDDLLNWIEETPDMTLQEISERLEVQRWQVEQIRKAKAKADSGGKFVGSEDMSAWANSLGSDDEIPLPEANLKRND